MHNNMINQSESVQKQFLKSSQGHPNLKYLELPPVRVANLKLKFGIPSCPPKKYGNPGGDCHPRMGKHHTKYLFEVSLKKSRPRDNSGQIGIIPKPESSSWFQPT